MSNIVASRRLLVETTYRAAFCIAVDMSVFYIMWLRCDNCIPAWRSLSLDRLMDSYVIFAPAPMMNVV